VIVPGEGPLPKALRELETGHGWKKPWSTRRPPWGWPAGRPLIPKNRDS